VKTVPNTVSESALILLTVNSSVSRTANKRHSEANFPSAEVGSDQKASQDYEPLKAGFRPSDHMDFVLYGTP
jgi:hypothetical protein